MDLSNICRSQHLAPIIAATWNIASKSKFKRADQKSTKIRNWKSSQQQSESTPPKLQSIAAKIGSHCSQNWKSSQPSSRSNHHSNLAYRKYIKN
jgi:hypothetical protein